MFVKNNKVNIKSKFVSFMNIKTFIMNINYSICNVYNIYVRVYIYKRVVDMLKCLECGSKAFKDQCIFKKIFYPLKFNSRFAYDIGPLRSWEIPNDKDFIV